MIQILRSTKEVSYEPSKPTLKKVIYFRLEDVAYNEERLKALGKTYYINDDGAEIGIGSINETIPKAGADNLETNLSMEGTGTTFDRVIEFAKKGFPVVILAQGRYGLTNASDLEVFTEETED